MTRKKIPQTVITFPNTTAAMATDALLGKEQGRLIPVPNQISAGCGLAWTCAPEKEPEILTLLTENHIDFENVASVQLYV